MFDTDLLIAFVVMALLFLRQIAILKKENKINYAPLMIGIGVIASLIHFIIHPDPSNPMLLLRESSMPFLVAMIFYIVMNILNQTKVSQNAKLHDEFTRILVREITQLKDFILDLETRMTEYSQEERDVQIKTQKRFQEDIAALATIQANQIEFTKKFDALQQWSEVKMPELNDVIHKHIDILRIAEQDHYNKLKELLQKGIESRFDISDDMQALKENLESMKQLSESVAETIVTKTSSKFAMLTQELDAEMLSLKLHAEGLKTTLYEDENVLSNIRTQSEMIMKQMILSANKMDALEKQTDNLHMLAVDIKALVQEMEKIKADYVKAQSQLTQLSSELSDTHNDEYKALQSQLEDLVQKLDKQHERAESTLTQSVQLMAKKAQLQKGYTALDD